MKKLIFVVIFIVFSATNIFCQSENQEESKYLIGFNAVLPRGTGPATALTNSMTPIEKSYGLGVTIQRKLTQNFSLFFDINAYDFNMFLAEAGEDVQSIWTVAEGAEHWDEPGAPQILYVHNLPTDVYFNMQATGIRLGAKYILGVKKVRPWIGAGFGFYTWEAAYLTKEKDKSYGSDKGTVTGLTFLGGVDFKVTRDFTVTAFADLTSPVAKYSIEGLFYPQWDITDYDSPVMGQYRFGLTLSFAPGKPSKK